MANRCPSPAVVFENTTPPSNNLLSALDTALTLPITALNDASLGYWNGILADTGAVNAYVVTVNFGAPTAYQAGMVVSFLAANTSTASNPTINVNALGVKTIVNPAGNALTGGEIFAGMVTHLFYDGTNFRIMWCPIMKDLGNIAGTTTTQNCSGATTIFVQASGNVTPDSPTIHLTNVAYGTPCMVRMQNTAGSGTFTFFLDLYDPAGNAIPTWVQEGAGTLQQVSGVTGGAGQIIGFGHQILLYGIPWYSGGIFNAYMIMRTA